MPAVIITRQFTSVEAQKEVMGHVRAASTQVWQAWRHLGHGSVDEQYYVGARREITAARKALGMPAPKSTHTIDDLRCALRETRQACLATKRPTL